MTLDNYFIVYDDVYKVFDETVGDNIDPSELYSIWLDTAWNEANMREEEVL